MGILLISDIFLVPMNKDVLVCDLLLDFSVRFSMWREQHLNRK